MDNESADFLTYPYCNYEVPDYALNNYDEQTLCDILLSTYNICFGMIPSKMDGGERIE